jgi:ADP-ribose pyrophosphatase YjhB (NUDIX family)
MEMSQKGRENIPNEAGTSTKEAADATPFGTKLKPISAFSASECSSSADLAKICFTASPVPSAESSLSYSSNASFAGAEMNSASDHGGDVSLAPLVQVNFASSASRDMFLFENNISSTSTAFVSSAVDPGQYQPEKQQDAFSKELFGRRNRLEADSTTLASESNLEISSSRMLPTVSRIGRENQRFETCSKTGRLIRLVTGTVPITNRGSILFVSAAKKREWILPKGGWELDETIEESALRETFEEAGVFGTLGPRLCDVIYETRKGRKRRLEEVGLLTAEKDAMKSTRVSTIAESKAIEKKDLEDETSRKDRNISGPTVISSVASTASGNSSEEDEPLSLCRQCSLSASNQKEAKKLITASEDNDVDFFTTNAAGENSALTPESTLPMHVSMCRMALFPLYISEVLEEWPESGRSRKIVPLDEAIQMSQREEIRQVLEEVKRRGLHQPTF